MYILLSRFLYINTSSSPPWCSLSASILVEGPHPSCKNTRSPGVTFTHSYPLHLKSKALPKALSFFSSKYLLNVSSFLYLPIIATKKLVILAFIHDIEATIFPPTIESLHVC